MPRDFKRALIKPLLKKPSLDPDDLKNYRPVSNLSFLSKILEKVVASRLDTHLELNDLQEPFQSAYRTCHSTETALVRVKSDLLETLDRTGSVAALVMLDLSAAFDTIDHQTLLMRLNRSFGIQGIVIDWIASYLIERYQTVVINDKTSKPALLDCGVPQGSVLGPKKYTYYTKPLGNIIKQHGLNYHCYADDTQIYLSFQSQDATSTQNAVQRIEHCLNDIYKWMNQNMLKLNSAKTELILFTSKRNSVPIDSFNVSFGGSSIIPSRCVKNLGVHLDKNLSMQDNVNAICKSAHLNIRNIGKIRKYLTTAATKSLVHGLVTSRIDYCNSLLYGLPVSCMDKLQRIQNVSARLVTRTPRRAHITPVLKQLHWLPLCKRIEYKILILTYRAIHQDAPNYIQDMLHVYTPRRNLRSQYQLSLVTPCMRTKTFGDKSFRVAAPKLWNNLPSDIKEAKTLRTFKTILKTHLFKQYFQ